jgi:hypothetical protein
LQGDLIIIFQEIIIIHQLRGLWGPDNHQIPEDNHQSWRFNHHFPGDNHHSS